MPALFAILVLVFASFTPTGYCGRPSDDPAYFGRLDSDAWKRLIEKRVEQQRAGQKKPDTTLTWKEYWTSCFRVTRSSPALPWKGSEFKTAEDMVRYVKAR